MQKRVVLIGGGGYASDVLATYEAIARHENRPHPVIGILDDNEIEPRRFLNRNIERIGTIDDAASVDATHFILAIGWPKTRRAVMDRIGEIPLEADTVIHPRAYVPPGVSVGPGCVILANCCVAEMVTIGRHTDLSHGTLIGHDAQLGDFVSVMPGASVSGDCVIEEGSLIGANATVIEGLTVGAHSTIGAGSVLTKNTPPGVVAIGAPARWKEVAHQAAA